MTTNNEKSKKLPVVIVDYFDNTLVIDGEKDLTLQECANNDYECCNTQLSYKMYVTDNVLIDNKKKSFIIKNSPELIPLNYIDEDGNQIDIDRDTDNLIDYENDDVKIQRNINQKIVPFLNNNMNLQLFYNNKIDYYKNKITNDGYLDFKVDIPFDINDSSDLFISYDELITLISLTFNSPRNINPLICEFKNEDSIISIDTNSKALIKEYFYNEEEKWYIKNSIFEDFITKNPEIKYKFENNKYEIVDYNFKGYVFSNINKEIDSDKESIIINPIKTFDTIRKGDTATLRFKVDITLSQFINEISFKKNVIDNYCEFKAEYLILKGPINNGIFKTSFHTNDISLITNKVVEEIYCDVDTDIEFNAKLSDSFLELGKNNILQIKVTNHEKRNKDVMLEIELDPDSHYNILQHENVYRNDNKVYWPIGNMDPNSNNVISLSLKALSLGQDIINISLYDYMNTDAPIQTKSIESLIINAKKDLLFNVTQDTDFVLPNQDNSYRVSIKNLTDTTINNVYVQVLGQNGLFFKDFALINNDEIVSESNIDEFPSDIGSVYNIGDIPRNRLIVFDIDTSVMAEGVYDTTFICWGDNTAMYTVSLKIECGYIERKKEIEHNIIIYNFTPIESHYQLMSHDFNDQYTVLTKERHKEYLWNEDLYTLKLLGQKIDDYDRVISSKNLDDLPVIHVPRENYGINVVEKYSGTNINNLIYKINKNSGLINVEKVRDGSGLLLNTMQPMYPNGLIHRFGLLKSELYHHTGVIPDINNEDYNIFKWKPNSIYMNEYPAPKSLYWNTKKWAGVLYKINRLYKNQLGEIINKQILDESFDNEHETKQFIKNQVLDDKLLIEELDNVFDIDYEISKRYYDGGIFSVNIPIDKIPSNFFVLSNEELFGIIEKTKPFGLRPIIKYTKKIQLDLRVDFDVYQKWYSKINLKPFMFDNINFWVFKKRYNYNLGKFMAHDQAYYSNISQDFKFQGNIKKGRLQDNESINMNFDPVISQKQINTAYKLKNIKDYLHLLNNNISFYKERIGQIPSSLNKEIVISGGTHPTLPHKSFNDCEKIEIQAQENIMMSLKRMDNIDTNYFGFYIKDSNKNKTFSFTYKNNRFELSKDIFTLNGSTNNKTVVVNNFDEIGLELVKDESNTEYAILYYSSENKWYFFDSFKLNKREEFGIFFYNNKINTNSIVFTTNTGYKTSNIINSEIHVALEKYYNISNQNISKIDEYDGNNKWDTLYRINTDNTTYALNNNKSVIPKKPNSLKFLFKCDNLPSNNIIKEINLKINSKINAPININAKTNLSCFVPSNANINLDFLNIDNESYIVKNNKSIILEDFTGLNKTDNNYFIIEGYNHGQLGEIKINNKIEALNKGYFYKEIKISSDTINMKFNNINKFVEIFNLYIQSDTTKEYSINNITSNDEYIKLLNGDIKSEYLQNGLILDLDFQELQQNEKAILYSIGVEILYQNTEVSFVDYVEADNILSIRNDGNALFTNNNLIEDLSISQKTKNSILELKDSVFQSFTANSKILSSIEFYVQGKVGNPNSELELSLYTDLNDSPNKKIISKIVNGWNSRDSVIKYNLFYPKLQIGTKYWIKLSMIERSKTNYYLLSYNSNYSITGKLLYTNNNNILNKNEGKACLAFNLYASGVIETFNFNLNKFKIINNNKSFFIQYQINAKSYNNKEISNIKINKEVTE